jgi:membrane protease YdiL (CAAX protease family)
MKRVLLFIISYFFIAGFFQVIGSLVIGADISDLDAVFTDTESLIVGAFGMFGVFVLLSIFMKYVDKEPFINLGFSVKGRAMDIATGLVVGAVSMGAGYYLLLSMGEIKFEGMSFNMSDFLITVGLFIIVAVVEEVLFRGYVLRNLMRSYNKYIALVISSILFALMHGINPNISWFGMFDLFLAGLALGVSYSYTKNLWFPIAYHFSWNFFQSHFGFNVSGQNFYSVIETSISNNNLINGGDFGFEGSIFSIVAELTIIAGIVYYYEVHKPSLLTLKPVVIN